MPDPYITRVGIRGAAGYATEIPALRSLLDEPIELDPRVTFFVGDNGSGKSTLVEAIAVAKKLNAEGGAKLTMSGGFTTRATHSDLHRALVLEGSTRQPVNAFFLRAESFYNYATNAVPMEYVLDEPEAALSVHGQLALMRRMHELVELESQFVVATHSPILLGYPHATILEFGEHGIARVAYEDTDPYRLTKTFLEDRDAFLHHLLEP